MAFLETIPFSSTAQFFTDISQLNKYITPNILGIGNLDLSDETTCSYTVWFSYILDIWIFHYLSYTCLWLCYIFFEHTHVYSFSNKPLSLHHWMQVEILTKIL